MSAITLTSGTVTVAMQAEPGGKISSLRHEPTGREWLLPPMRGPVGPVPDGVAFTDADMSGWDEMFPTISPCPDPARPEVMLPDHGALWAIPWTVGDRSDRHVAMSVSGPAGAYTFSRVVRVAADRVTLDYTVTNHADTALHSLWSAHPQFAAGPATRVVLPSGTRVRNVLDGTFLGPGDSTVAWPAAVLPDGTTRAIDSLAGLAPGTFWKLYADPAVPVASAALVDGDGGPWLRMAWTPEVPYVGLWMDQTAVADAPVIAIEPSTGYYDAVFAAAESGQVPILGRGESLRWQVIVDLGSGSFAG